MKVERVDIFGDWWSSGRSYYNNPTIADLGDGRIELKNQDNPPQSGTGVRLTNTIIQVNWANNMMGKFRGDGKVLVWSNGTWWSRKEFDKISTTQVTNDLAGNWRINNWEKCYISGPNHNLQFKNQYAPPQISSGKLLGNSITVQANEWPYEGHPLRGRVVNNGSLILWENGTWWDR